MKKYLLIFIFYTSISQLLAQSTILLPNGTVIPSMTQANRPASPTTGQLIYQTDGTTGLYIWSGIAWMTVSASGGGNGTVTNVSANSPISVTNASTTPNLSISQANGSTNGFLSSGDWTAFSNKFSLPILTNGSVLFSNGTSINQNNNNFFWDNTNNRLGIGVNTPAKTLDISGAGGLRVNTTNDGSGTIDWIASNVGSLVGDRVVSGNLLGTATIGAHNNALNSWAKLAINPTGVPVGIGTSNPNNSAVLDVNSTTSGVLLPRMTQSQRLLIANPSNGLTVYQTDEPSGYYVYKGSTWALLAESIFFGDGSGGAFNSSGNDNWTTNNTLNLQFTSFTLNDGHDLHVLSGTTIRVLGDVVINGNIIVNVGAKGTPFTGGSGVALTPAQQVFPGINLPDDFQTIQYISQNVNGGGAGYGSGELKQYSPSGGDGGGYICIKATGTITFGSTGKIKANGSYAIPNTGFAGGGGGAGGVIILVSNTAINSNGTLEAIGGNAANGGITSSASRINCGGGGGGGGIIYLLSKAINHNSDVLNVNGGSSGAPTSTSPTAVIYGLGGGGGACGGAGGWGGYFDNTIFQSQSGNSGKVIERIISNPVSFYQQK